MRRARPCSGRRRPRQDPRGGRAPLRNRRRDAMRRPRPRPRGRCARCPGSPSPAGRTPVRRLIFKKLEDDAARKIDECAVDLNAGDADDLTEIRPVQPRSPSRLPSEEDSQKARASSRLATLTPIWWTPEATAIRLLSQTLRRPLSHSLPQRYAFSYPSRHARVDPWIQGRCPQYWPDGRRRSRRDSPDD